MIVNENIYVLNFYLLSVFYTFENDNSVDSEIICNSPNNKPFMTHGINLKK